MKTKILLGLGALLSSLALLSFYSPAQGNRLLRSIVEQLDIYEKELGPEKTYIQTDKDVYLSGETIWFKTYLLNGITHRESDKSRVMYVELLNSRNQLIATRKLLVSNTSAFGDILIGDAIPSGNYLLRCYTKYRLNDTKTALFEKEIVIARNQKLTEGIQGRGNKRSEPTNSGDVSLDSDAFNISFHPESGQLVEGLPAVMGIKVTDSRGFGKPFSGTIKTAAGRVVSSFSGSLLGLGVTNFMPLENEVYYAHIEGKGETRMYKIPAPLKTGYGLNIRNRGSELIVQVSSTKNKDLDGTVLIGHLRGKIILKRLGRSYDEHQYAVRLATDNLPSGVANFTLFTPKGKIFSERLVYIDPKSNQPNVVVRSSTEKPGPAEKARFDIEISDVRGRPLQGDFSVSVAPAEDYFETTSSQLKGWMLLNSDLAGTVQNSNVLVDNRSVQGPITMDALMLTQRWKRFNWNDLINETERNPLEYQPEKGIMVTGTTKDFDDKSVPKKTTVRLNLIEQTYEEEQFTDADGRFSFGPYLFNDTLNAVIQAKISNVKNLKAQKNIDVQLDSEWPTLNLKNDFDRSNTEHRNRANLYSVSEAFAAQYGDNVTELKEVVVQSKRLTPGQRINDAINRSTPYGTPNLRIYKDSISGSESLSLIELLERKGAWAGLQIISVNNDIRPLITIDGTPTDFSAIKDMRANEVKYVDIVRRYNSGASIYGSRGAAGVIAIYSWLPSEAEAIIRNERLQQVPGISSVAIKGFSKVSEFSSLQNRPHTLRPTLFWNPTVRLDGEGRAAVEFDTKNIKGGYVLKIEGVTEDGRLVDHAFHFQVENLN